MNSKSVFRALFFSAVVALFAACATSKQVIEPQQPKHKTAEVKRATVYIVTGSNKASVSCQMQTVFDSLCIVSVQPLSGMEVAVMFATPEDILLIDRMHKTYAITDYETINKISNPKINFKFIQGIVSGEGLPEGIMTQTKHFSDGKRDVDVTITYPAIIYDRQMNLRPKKLDGYTKVNLQTLIDKIL